MGQARFVKLRYTRPALADLNSILDYIAAHSPPGDRRVHARIQAILDLLLLYPGIGTRTDDPAILGWRRCLTPMSFSTRPRKPRSSFTRFVMRRAILPVCREHGHDQTSLLSGDDFESRRRSKCTTTNQPKR